MENQLPTLDYEEEQVTFELSAYDEEEEEREFDIVDQGLTWAMCKCYNIGIS